MVYSDKQIKEMSNYEINLAVARKSGIKFNFDKNNVFVVYGNYFKIYSPTTDEKDAINLSKNFKICINWDKYNKDYIYITNGIACVYTKYLERGICEVFLMTDYGGKE